MKRLKKLMNSPKVTMAVFAAAVVLLLFSTIGGARASVISWAENLPEATIGMTAISTALTEENAGTEGAKTIEEGDALLTGMLESREKIKPGKKYEEKLSVENRGETDQYVRVTVYKYWTKKVSDGVDADGTAKEMTVTDRTADPEYIRLHLLTVPETTEGEETSAGGDWIVDKDASTTERTVLYYRKPLKAGESAAFLDGLTIDDAVAGIMKTGEDDSVSYPYYPYKDLSFEVKVEVDAVQPRHTEEAILSAWGREVKIDDDGNLSLAPRRSSVSWEEDSSVSGNEGSAAGGTGSGTESTEGNNTQAGQEGGSAG